MSWTRHHQIRLGASLGLFLLVMVSYASFLRWIESRPGTIHSDPILMMLPSCDFTWPIFAIISGVLILSGAHLFRHPQRLVLGIQAYTLMVLFRIVVMSLVPFDPPVGMIILQDPLVDLFGANPQPLTRDLFFSGHTATLFLLSLLALNPKMKAGFLICTFVTAVLLLFQHVHYTVDVIAAPFFAYASFKLIEWKNRAKTTPKTQSKR